MMVGSLCVLMLGILYHSSYDYCGYHCYDVYLSYDYCVHVWLLLLCGVLLLLLSVCVLCTVVLVWLFLILMLLIGVCWCCVRNMCNNYVFIWSLVAWCITCIVMHVLYQCCHYDTMCLIMHHCFPVVCVIPVSITCVVLVLLLILLVVCVLVVLCSNHDCLMYYDVGFIVLCLLLWFTVSLSLSTWIMLWC